MTACRCLRVRRWARSYPATRSRTCKAFIEAGGQRGPQRQILREGTYAFNLAQFIVITEAQIYYLPMGTTAQEQGTIQMMAQHLTAVDGFNPIVIKGADDKTGIVTVNDGPSLPMGDIIAPNVGDQQDDANYHNNFQDPEAFLAGGGFRGRQYQVLTEGTYFVNRLFATVELINKIVVPVGYAGVVVSYYGPKGVDTSGEEYRHGELVAMGNRGVWSESLMPGKYAFNTYAGSISMVPTTNIILKWIAGRPATTTTTRTSPRSASSRRTRSSRCCRCQWSSTSTTRRRRSSSSASATSRCS